MKTISFLKLSMVLALVGLVNNTQAQCVASFSIGQGAPGNYSFTSTSVGTTSTTGYYFDFGNGQSSGMQYNPSASTTYTTNQVYTVTMYLSDSTTNCFTSVSQTIGVSNVGCNFTLSINQVAAPNGLVYFSTNAGNQTFSYNWNFGDNTTSNQAAPAHTYSASGVYNVTLTAISGGGFCNYTAIKTLTISVAPCSLTAGIAFSQVGQGQVNFSSASTGTTSQTNYYWSFGDGNYAYTANPSHTYLTNNLYNVSLMVSDSSSFFCSSTATAAVSVTNALCQNLTNFSMSKDSTQQLTWNAYPYYPSNISNVTWYWGDGSSTNGLYPSHTYSAAGIYTICLSATVSCGTSTTYCLSQSIYKSTAGESAMVTLNVKGGGPTGITEGSEVAGQIRIFPNPSSGFVKIEAASGGVEIIIRDLPGKIVYKAVLNGSEDIDLHMLQNGVYFMSLQGEGINQNERLVIQH